jgi:hypothetical protein
VYLCAVVALAEVEDRRWWLDLEVFQSLGGGIRGLSNLPDGAVGAGQLRQLNALEVVADVAPGVLAGVLDDPFKQQREHGDGDGGMDTMDRPVWNTGRIFRPLLSVRQASSTRCCCL